MSHFTGLRRKYHTEIVPIMMIPGVTYLMTNNVISMKPTEITFSLWEYLPSNEQLSIGVKMYFTLPNDKNEKEYYLVVYKNKRGEFAGNNNFKFYKDYDNIIEY
jgi:hypothetical protein